MLNDAMEAEGRSGLERELEIHRAIVQLYPNEHFTRAFDSVANELRVAILGNKLDNVSAALNSYDYKPLIRVIRTRDHDRSIELLTDCINGFATRLLQAIGPTETKVVEHPPHADASPAESGALAKIRVCRQSLAARGSRSRVSAACTSRKRILYARSTKSPQRFCSGQPRPGRKFARCA